jgi:ubiquinone/menaquinone biosynthesis C-methylase UbiE
MSHGEGNGYEEVAQEFNHKARVYDEQHLEPDSIMGLHQRLRDLWLDELVDGKGRMLEVGCGTGLNLKHLSRRIRSVGIDISRGMLKEGRAKDLTVCEANGEILPFKDGSFDYVICINALQYFDDLPMIMSEVRRVLGQEGRFILDFKNSISGRAAVHCLLRAFHRKKGRELEKWHSVFAVEELLGEFGWKIERMIGMEFHFLQMGVNPIKRGTIEWLFKMEKYLSSSGLRFLAGRIMLSAIRAEGARG